MSETRGWTKVAELGEIPEEGALGIETDDETPIVLVRSEGEVFALRDVCSHAEVRLSEGEVEDGTIECWLHGSASTCARGRRSTRPRPSRSPPMT